MPPAATEFPESALGASGNLFRDVVELASEGIAIVDAGYRIRYGNPRIHEMLGYAAGELVGRHVADFLALGYEPATTVRDAVTGIPPTPAAQVYRLIHHDGHTIEALISLAHRTGPGGDYSGSVAMLTDVTELRRAERALHESSRQFAIVLDSVDESIWRLDLPGGRIFLSAGFFAALGHDAGDTRTDAHTPFDEWLGQVHEDDRDALLGALTAAAPADARIREVHYRYRHRDGSWRWIQSRYRATAVDQDGRPVEVAGTSVDVTQRKQQELELREALAQQRALNQRLEETQNQLLQSEKMASLGQLAAGVAHELNNPIGFIQSNLTTLEQYLTEIFAVADAYRDAEGAQDPGPLAEVQRLKQEYDFDFLREDIGQLILESLDGIDRVTRIVRDLKDFSRAGEATWQWVDVHECINSTLNIAWNEIKYKCQVTRDFGTLPRIHCVPSQLNQVFMNLFVNAAHAIAERGDLIITTRPQGEDAIQITISDSGSGMPPDVMKRIFEPFYTTKPVGKGTGLGLSIAYGIVSRHGGRIEVESRAGQGTTFTLTLPLRPPQGDAGAMSEPPADASS